MIATLVAFAPKCPVIHPAKMVEISDFGRSDNGYWTPAASVCWDRLPPRPASRSLAGKYVIDELRDKHQRPASGADLLSVEFVHELMPSVIDAKD
jgi:hypothetical protein